MKSYVSRILVPVLFVTLIAPSAIAQHLYTKGVVIMSDNYHGGTPVIIYSQTGKIIRQFLFNTDTNRNATIHPFRYNQENSLLIFNCLSETDKCYKVIIDEAKKQVGYIPKSDKHFRYESWVKHLTTSVVVVDFDFRKNPLHVQSWIDSHLLKVKPAEFYFPKQVVGNWLRVTWDTPTKGTGWIMWKDGHNNVLVQLFYDM